MSPTLEQFLDTSRRYLFAERLNAVQPLAAEDPAIAEILAFIDCGKHRPLCLPADSGSRA